ncbi:hypothetical protein J1N35_038294 [Gossypium stocksii]|uniref:Uncharacterized protein n=1 Tax=Gossypium stocksii TaxID=47602 RepID=A0A9D3ZMR5_9ROSI|nr:hypothetical protein J1N35_038294 [Gossypium stocksii]
MVIGDFNKIMFSFEKKGSRLRSDRNMTRFRETLKEYDLNDLDTNDETLIELEEVKLALKLKPTKKNYSGSNKHDEKKSRVRKLRGPNGEWIVNEKEKLMIVMNYFKELFRALDTRNNGRMLLGIKNCVNKNMVRVLTEEFRVKEITTTIKIITLLKAYRVDDYPVLFYHKYWHIMGEEIISFCLDILNRRDELGDISNACIVLIPKVN